MDDENDGEGENENLGAASAEPTDADLLQILNGGESGGKPAAKSKTKAKAEAAAIDAEESDEDLDDDDDDDGDGDTGAGKKKAAKAAADDEAGDDEVDESDSADEADQTADQGENDEGDESADDEAADDAAGDDDPDAALDAEDRKVRAKFTPEQQERFDKAVSKKTRRILELKTELREEQTAREAAEARAAEIEKAGATSAAVPTAENPLADIEDEAKLDSKLTEARKLRRFALANPDGAFVDKKTGSVVEVDDPENPPENVVAFSKKRIGEILADTEELIQEHGPKHRKFLQDRAVAEGNAVKTFPWLKNTKSMGYIAVETTLRHAPQLRSIPGIKFLLADAFVGRGIRLQAQQQQQRTKGTKPEAQKVNKAPPSPGGGARPPKGDAKRKAAGNALEAVAKTGDDPGDAALRAILRS